MTRSRGWTLWLLVAFVLGFLALVLAPQGGADSSTLSRQGGGWWVLWRYAEARGVDAVRLDRPLDRVFSAEGSATGDAFEDTADGPAHTKTEDTTGDTAVKAGDGVLVLGFPWQVGQRLGESGAVERHLRAGGTVVATYRLDQFTDLDPIWRTLGVDGEEPLREAPPVSPTAWWRYRGERWSLAPTDELPRGPRLELPAFFSAPAAPPGARVLYATGDEALRAGAPVVWIHPRMNGRVVVLPSDLFTNAELRRSANADFVETLFDALGEPWLFDEYHHGLVDPELVADGGGKAYSWDLFLLHLGVLYLLAVWALGRPFGEAWSDPPVHHGSAASFLRSLGTLHQRLGHHRDAAARLLERSLDHAGSPDADDVEDLRREAEAVDDGESLLRFARRLSSRRP